MKPLDTQYGMVTSSSFITMQIFDNEIPVLAHNLGNCLFQEYEMLFSDKGIELSSASGQ